VRTAEDLRPLWTVPQLAKYLQQSPQEVRRAIREGRLPGVVKLGPRSTRIDPAVVKAWIRAGAPDLEGARRYLRETLPAGEPIEITDPGVLDAAAAVVARSP
jgi:excisionase family DNA binding protein